MSFSPRSHRSCAATRRPHTRGGEQARGLVASQILGLVIGRYVLRLPVLVNRQTEDLVAEVGPTVQRYVDGLT